MHSFRNEFFTCLFKIQNVQVIQNDVIKCCKMMSSNVALLHSNNCCVLEPAICQDLDLHVVILVVSDRVVLSHGTLRFITGIDWKFITSNDRLFGFPIIYTDKLTMLLCLFFTSTIIDQLLVTGRKRSLGQLSREGCLCPRGRGLCPRESDLCLRGRGLCPRGRVSVQGGLCPGGSLSGGSLFWGFLCRGDPSRTETAPIW